MNMYMRALIAGVSVLFVAAAGAPELTAESRSTVVIREIDVDSPMKVAMDRILRGKRGEAILTDLRTGEQWISGGTRAHAAYNGASTFKLLTAYYGLTEGLIDPDVELDCKPFRFGGKRIRCWRRRGHGTIALREALGTSCNGLFYTVGMMPGARSQELEKLARAVGYEPAPTRSTKPELFGHGDGWYISPINQARLIGAIATAGTPQAGADKVTALFTDNEALRVIRQGMRRTLIDGTAKHADISRLPLAGKTGTLGKQGWFLSYAPYYSPRISCVVHLDRAWGHQAASLTKKILESHLQFRELPPEQFALSLEKLRKHRKGTKAGRPTPKRRKKRQGSASTSAGSGRGQEMASKI